MSSREFSHRATSPLGSTLVASQGSLLIKANDCIYTDKLLLSKVAFLFQCGCSSKDMLIHLFGSSEGVVTLLRYSAANKVSSSRLYSPLSATRLVCTPKGETEAFMFPVYKRLFLYKWFAGTSNFISPL